MNRSISILILTLASLSGTPVLATCPPGLESPERLAEARGYLEDRYPDGDVPGASVVAACDGEIVFSFASGMADIEWRRPIGTTTSFRVGSISKPLTAVAVLRLVEEGRINLDLPVSSYVSNLPAYMRPVTVRQLLSHTSGLPDILLTPSLIPYARDWVSEWQVIGMQAKTPPRAAPGETWDYSNFNYVLLAVVLEAVTDTSYSEYMDEQVFGPLGLERTRYDARRAILPGGPAATRPTPSASSCTRRTSTRATPAPREHCSAPPPTSSAGPDSSSPAASSGPRPSPRPGRPNPSPMGPTPATAWASISARSTDAA